jgi:formate/nitrite transporter FocA (FNT family)
MIARHLTASRAVILSGAAAVALVLAIQAGRTPLEIAGWWAAILAGAGALVAGYLLAGEVGARYALSKGRPAANGRSVGGVCFGLAVLIVVWASLGA